jgi:RNA polymerase sigma-70 factor (ECF subfamily)
MVRGYVQSADEAEDVMQASYVRAYAALDSFRGDARLSTWLARIALNEALGRLRRGRRMTSLDDPGVDDHEHSVARSEIRLLLEHAVDELPVAFRTVFMLRAIEQLSTEEVALCLNIPPATVKTRFHRAKRRLREVLKDRLDNTLIDVFPFAGARCEKIADRVMDQLGFAAMKSPD